MKKTSHLQMNSWFLRPDSYNDPLVARLLGNLLLHGPQRNHAPFYDTELEFLENCPGFALVVCAVSCHADTRQTMQNLVQQQADAYPALAEAMHKASEDAYFCVTTELENQFVALLIPKSDTEPLEELFPNQISGYLRSCLYQLIHIQGIPLYTVYSVQKKSLRLNQSYTRIKNAIIFQDYLQSGTGQLMAIGDMEPKPHIGLWNRMEDGATSFTDAILHNDVDQALTCVYQMIDAITAWIPPSKDTFLTDVQYFLDIVFNRIANQFGNDLIQGLVVTDVIFESESIAQLRSGLKDFVQSLFQKVRRDTSDSTFHLFMDVRNYINENVRDYALTAGNVAAHFCISPQLLSIQFKRCFNISPSQYIEQKRVELIKDYLLHTTLSLDKICELVGMGSVSTLHRVFRKHCGQSPSLFRQAAKTRLLP